MRKWRPTDVPADADWSVKHQIVLPKGFRTERQFHGLLRLQNSDILFNLESKLEHLEDSKKHNTNIYFLMC